MSAGGSRAHKTEMTLTGAVEKRRPDALRFCLCLRRQTTVTITTMTSSATTPPATPPTTGAKTLDSLDAGSGFPDIHNSGTSSIWSSTPHLSSHLFFYSPSLLCHFHPLSLPYPLITSPLLSTLFHSFYSPPLQFFTPPLSPARGCGEAL